MNIDEARKPAIIERNGTRIGFLSYNCIGPMGSWATPAKPGCAWVRVITAYEMNMPIRWPTGKFIPSRSLAASE